MNSKDLNRTQLIGMIARLRGALIDVILNYKHQDLPTGSKEELKESIEYGEMIMNTTDFNLSIEDGEWFDNSWEEVRTDRRKTTVIKIIKRLVRKLLKMDRRHPGDLYEEAKQKLLEAQERYYESINKHEELIHKPCAYCEVIIKSHIDKHKEDCREGLLNKCLEASIDIEYWTEELNKRKSNL